VVADDHPVLAMTALARVVVTGGGTAGHVFTGLAILDAVRCRHPKAETLFIGGPTGHEVRLVPMSPHRFAAVDARPLRAHGALSRAGASLRLPGAVLQSLRLLASGRPDVVLGIGGAASGPVLMAARMLGIPTALHEQNALPGLANRLAGRFVDRIFVGLPQAGGPFVGNARVQLTGNPIRSELLQAFAEPHMPDSRDGNAKSPWSLLILGGSDGSPFINRALPSVLRGVANVTGAHLRVRHQAGPADLDGIARAYRHPHIRAEVVPFFSDMAHVYRDSDVAITPGGALTLAELAHVGLPALVVPFGASADDHQRYNAEHFARVGSVILFDEAAWPERHVVAVLARLLSGPAERNTMATAARRLATPEAAVHIVAALEAMR
jgi:UDP-N-acetylglucosamine--N-acetylmuramyl-(pentapeptide) pyrophosphoryl-undecaprenol N-acetylglucosamine transferase